MATGTEAPIGGNTQNLALERCLGILRTAKNDSEQFAALLLITKCVKAEELDNGARHRIFDVVGFSFLNRLLFSKNTPDGCPDYLYQSLGLTLLACFCTDPSLASHPQSINKIPILNETLNISCQDDLGDLNSMVEDAYQCLLGILASPEGGKHLVTGGTISSLCEAYIKQNHGWTTALRILTSLLASLPDKSWKKSCNELQCLLVKLSEDFDNEGDSHKFHLAEILPVFLPPSPLLIETSWGANCLRHLTKGLLKILSSKLSISQRDPALKLAACLSNIYGSSWIMIEGRGDKAKFLSLLVNLACVEVRMALEDPLPLDSRQAPATACYTLVEMGIQECTKEEGYPVLREDQKLQLLQVMQEACAAVIYYLQQVGWERMEDPFILASVRLLGAWLAEETSCFRKEVIQLLPFLIHYMRTWFQRGVTYRNQLKEASQMALLSSSWGAVWPGDAIRFLLPALCHLSAEEGPRKILISEGVPALLCEYYQQKWEIFSSEKEVTAERKYEAQLSLQSCCGVFLNVVVTEPTFVGQESCFVTLLKLLMQSLPVLLTKEGQLVLVANISTLGLMMSRLHASSLVLQESFSQDFFLAVIKFLSHCHVMSSHPDEEKPHIVLSDSYAAAWTDISELWFLGVQAFSACLPLLPWLSSLVLTSGWLQDLLGLLDKVSPQSVDLELVTVLQALLTQLAQVSVPCRELIQHHGGVEKANLFGMAALEQCLSEML
ncbi:neurochondrin [Hyla sarda]|uniref:neurochondrin n=1 Tax=Hyla sarda TaxID=327740 RepID=UPI0024C300D9|nr:neurochondrin [Hyla sarda]XP_056413179.1 neurochondrin [Hyla sarda]